MMDMVIRKQAICIICVLDNAGMRKLKDFKGDLSKDVFLNFFLVNKIFKTIIYEN
jgi:hypothetical protein